MVGNSLCPSQVGSFKINHWRAVYWSPPLVLCYLWWVSLVARHKCRLANDTRDIQIFLKIAVSRALIRLLQLFSHINFKFLFMCVYCALSHFLSHLSLSHFIPPSLCALPAAVTVSPTRTTAGSARG